MELDGRSRVTLEVLIKIAKNPSPAVGIPTY